MMSKAHQSTPFILAFAGIGVSLYGASIYFSILNNADPGMPWRLGSYCLGSAVILYLMRRGWKFLPSILLALAFVAILNLTRAQLESTDHISKQSRDTASAFSVRMEDIQSRIDSIGFNRILRPEQLMSAESIADSRRRLAKYATLVKNRDALVRQYFEANERSRETGKGKPATGNTLEKWSNLSKAQFDTIALSYEILDFVNGNLENATLGKDEILFKTPDQIRRYKELTNRMSELKRIEMESWKAIDCLSGKSRLCI